MSIEMADYKLNIVVSDRAKKSITFRIVSPDMVAVSYTHLDVYKRQL